MRDANGRTVVCLFIHHHRPLASTLILEHDVSSTHLGLDDPLPGTLEQRSPSNPSRINVDDTDIFYAFTHHSHSLACIWSVFMMRGGTQRVCGVRNEMVSRLLDRREDQVGRSEQTIE